ncbi:MAG: ribosomal protein S18-alanine N-acetyltransferase [Candidatus Bathyarchaeota archaeon]|nr:ribosomal protein S18-alanine N-acetyltransferase [Candidatus Bathyarchaeota archaeon]
MELKIETATITHIDKLYRIEEACFDQEAFTKRQIAYLLTDYNSIALLAKANNVIAGFIITQIDIDEYSQFGHIITINVPPNYRRRHVATALIRETERILKEKGIKECRLEVREDNHAAQKLYQTLGYQITGKLDNYYGKKHGLHLKKSL